MIELTHEVEMDTDELCQLVIDALEDRKGKDITVLDVCDKTSVTDIMLIVSGTSSRHVKSLANSVIEQAKNSGEPPLGVEGERQAEWILVDLGDVVVHVMQPKVREFYQLEKLWSTEAVIETRL